MMSHLVLLLKKDEGVAVRSIFNTAAFVARNFSKFFLIATIASGDLSKKYANFAPRDNASIPSAPDPAKQSSTIFSAKFSTQSIELSMSKITCRERDRVGRAPSGASKTAPLYLPATILIMI